MDGTIAQHCAKLDVLDTIRSSRRAIPHLVVDEVRAIGLCGPGGRCMITLLWLEDRVLASLHTLGKARVALRGTSLFSCQYEFFDELIAHSRIVHEHNDLGYFLNYARPLIYMTRLTMPISSVPRIPSYSSKTAQPKRYIFPF
jgi:hypothetical protein